MIWTYVGSPERVPPFRAWEPGATADLWRNYPKEFGPAGKVGVPAGNRANTHLQELRGAEDGEPVERHGAICQDFAMAEGMSPILDAVAVERVHGAAPPDRRAPA